MLRRSLLTLVLVLAAAAAPAQLRIEHYELPNGLDVVLNEDHSAPLVAVNVWYHVGSKNEVPGRTGFAHLFEHMLFSGSKNVGPNEHFRHVQSVGGTLNGSTNFDRTNYYQTLPSNYLSLGLWLEADRMGFFLPTISQERLDVQKNVVKEERRLRVDNQPYGIWLEALLRLGFVPSHPYSWPIIGSMADLTAAQLEDVKAFFQRYYAPNNAVLTITGDFDPSEAKALVSKYFASIPKGPPIERPNPAVRRGAGEVRETLEGAVQLPRVYRMYRVPRYGERGWHATSILGNILGRDKASRLERALVYEQQIAQDLVIFTLDTEAEGMIVLWSTAKEGVTPEKIEAALDAELEKVIRNGVTAEELERAKIQIETDFAHEMEDFAARADFLSGVTTYFGDPKIAHTWLDRYRQITREDVQNIARDMLKKEDRVTLVYLPQKKAPAATGGAQ